MVTPVHRSYLCMSGKMQGFSSELPQTLSKSVDVNVPVDTNGGGFAQFLSEIPEP